MAITLSGDSPNLTSASLTTPTLTSPTFAGTPSGSIITSGTAVASTSGTSIDFTSIPSWVKRITVMFSGVSTNGSSNIQVQLGDAGGVETTGYFSTSSNQTDITNITTGFVFNDGSTTSAGAAYSGALVISNIANNSWVAMGCGIREATNCGSIAGSKTLSDTLTQVRITTVNGTDTFDAGSINILYE